MNLEQLFRKRLIIVTGKGGVGKTTISLSLAVLNATYERSSVVAFTGGIERNLYNHEFDEYMGNSENKLDSYIHTISIDPNTALKEYFRENLVKLYPLYAPILRSKTLQSFFEAAPGLRELITIGKVWHLGNKIKRGRSLGLKYNQVIFDAPSTGHAIPILDLPRKVLEMVKGGTFRNHVEWVEGFLKDPEQTGLVIVATPEEMVVRESLELINSVKSIGINITLIVVNNVYHKIFDEKDEKTLKDLIENERAREIMPAINFAKTHIERAKASKKYIKHLRAGGAEKLLLIPHIFKKDLSNDDLLGIALEIGTQLRKENEFAKRYC